MPILIEYEHLRYSYVYQSYFLFSLSLIFKLSYLSSNMCPRDGRVGQETAKALVRARSLLLTYSIT